MLSGAAWDGCFGLEQNVDSQFNAVERSRSFAE